MVRRLPARPSQLPDWYSSGVHAGLFLHRVKPLHLEGLRGGNLAYHTSLGGQSVGRTTPSYTFPPEAEASGQRAYAMWWIRMLFHSFESSALPFLGIKTHFSEVGLWDAGPAHFSHLAFFSRPSCATSTLGRDLSVLRHGYLVPRAFSDAARVPEEERL